MIKVLHIIDHLRIGGAQSLLLDLAARDENLDVECEIAALYGVEGDSSRFEEIGINVTTLAENKWSIMSLFALAKLVRLKRFDILHFHLNGANWVAKPFCALFPSAYRVEHDHYPPEGSARAWPSILLRVLTRFFSHHVIAVSDAVADVLFEREFVEREKVSVIPNGVDTVRFDLPSERLRTEARAAFGLKIDAFVVGVLGRLEPGKNLGCIVSLARAISDVEFLVGGEGSEADALNKASRGINNFTLLGKVNDRRLFYASIDAFILPSRAESFGLVAAEAMACGLPVVASDIPAVATILGDTNFLIEIDDQRALLKAVKYLSRNRSEAKIVGKIGRDRVCAHFDARDARVRMANLYARLLFQRANKLPL